MDVKDAKKSKIFKNFIGTLELLQNYNLSD